MENTFSGLVLDPAYLEAATALARKHRLGTHLDGARLMNTSMATCCDADVLAEGSDTVSLCLSKELGASIGPVLAGPKDLIRAARRLRKMLSAGMWQTGIHALEHNVERRRQKWSGIFDQFAALPSSGMGFMSGSGSQVLVGGITGLSGRQQSVR